MEHSIIVSELYIDEKIYTSQLDDNIVATKKS